VRLGFQRWTLCVWRGFLTHCPFRLGILRHLILQWVLSDIFGFLRLRRMVAAWCRRRPRWSKWDMRGLS
jgi:hypothetical protein